MDGLRAGVSGAAGRGLRGEVGDEHFRLAACSPRTPNNAISLALVKLLFVIVPPVKAVSPITWKPFSCRRRRRVVIGHVPHAGSSPAPIGIRHSAIETSVNRPRRRWPGLANLRIRARPTTGNWVRFTKMANHYTHHIYVNYTQRWDSAHRHAQSARLA